MTTESQTSAGRTTGPAAGYDLARLAVERLGAPQGRFHFVWGHGWGQNRDAMKGLAQSLFSLGTHDFLDFPGFGASPRPDATWTTADYANLVQRWLETNRTGAPVVWVGHSFGGRVGIQLAARHPDAVSRIVLIAAAGLPRQRSPLEQARLKGRVWTYKALKRLAPLAGISEDDLRAKFGSADYQNAGAMRDIFLEVIREDLTDQARRITCSVYLVYGAKDTETPPEIGRRLEALIPNASLTVLGDLDHYSVLGEGRHQVAKRIKIWLEETPE
jgi:pimeloyl-ACP methyl ester carboxylesterase